VAFGKNPFNRIKLQTENDLLSFFFFKYVKRAFKILLSLYFEFQFQAF